MLIVETNTNGFPDNDRFLVCRVSPGCSADCAAFYNKVWG